MRGFRVVTAVGEMRVGRIVGSQGDYYIVKRSFGRGRYPLPKHSADVDPDRRRVLIRVPRKTLFEAPKVARNGELDPATDGHYSAEPTSQIARDTDRRSTRTGGFR